MPDDSIIYWLRKERDDGVLVDPHVLQGIFLVLVEALRYLSKSPQLT